MTAPDFCPFERKFKGIRHLDQATFLHSEEGEKWNEGRESEIECSISVPRSEPGPARGAYHVELFEEEYNEVFVGVRILEASPVLTEASSVFVAPEAIFEAPVERVSNVEYDLAAPSESRISRESASSKTIYIDQVMERAHE